MNSYAAKVTPVEEHIAQTTSPQFMSIFFLVQILSILIGVACLFVCILYTSSKKKRPNAHPGSVFYFI
ncbi:hypothetical protein N750_01420 [Legionella pneumophila str. Leg01/53]|nr:hypothetical protein N750_01420 [Legionella pneumophila str. Leg01/53]